MRLAVNHPHFWMHPKWLTNWFSLITTVAKLFTIVSSIYTKFLTAFQKLIIYLFHIIYLFKDLSCPIRPKKYHWWVQKLCCLHPSFNCMTALIKVFWNHTKNLQQQLWYTTQWNSLLAVNNPQEWQLWIMPARTQVIRLYILYIILYFSEHLKCLIFLISILAEMIGKLTLTFNRTRQAVITRELIEIISGAAALE